MAPKFDPADYDMQPIAKAAIAVFGGNGDYGFLKSFQRLKKSRPVADEHFSIDNLRFNRNDIPMRFTFVEFATWDDAMKAMWDGFSLGFMAFICTFFPDGDPAEAYDQMGRHITKHENIMAGTKVPYLVVIVDKDVYSSDGDPKAMAEAFPIPPQFPSDQNSRAIAAPGLEKWGQDGEYKSGIWFHDMCRFREQIITKPLNASLKGESYWEFKEHGRGYGTEINAEIFVLPKDDGGALIADGDRRTVIHGPNEIEGTFKIFYSIRNPLLPGKVRTMKVHLDEGVSHVNKKRHFMVKQDGKLVAFGVFEKL